MLRPIAFLTAISMASPDGAPVGPAWVVEPVAPDFLIFLVGVFKLHSGVVGPEQVFVEVGYAVLDHGLDFDRVEAAGDHGGGLQVSFPVLAGHDAGAAFGQGEVADFGGAVFAGLPYVHFSDRAWPVPVESFLGYGLLSGLAEGAHRGFVAGADAVEPRGAAAHCHRCQQGYDGPGAVLFQGRHNVYFCGFLFIFACGLFIFLIRSLFSGVGPLGACGTILGAAVFSLRGSRPRRSEGISRREAGGAGRGGGSWTAIYLAVQVTMGWCYVLC